jgi:hypothetical protein
MIKPPTDEWLSNVDWITIFNQKKRFYIPGIHLE